MNSTTHYNLNVPVGTDLFNPLTIDAPNWTTIDTGMWNNKISAIPTATELVSSNNHAITRTVTSAPMFRFVATGDVVAGDTFTVDGNQVNAYTTDGQPLGANCYKTGAMVLCCLDGQRLTVFTSGSSLPASINATTLENHPASYFAVASTTASKSVGYSANLTVADWVLSGDVYVQDATIAGVTTTNNIIVSPAPASWETFGECAIRATAQSTDTVTFTANTAPTEALYANVVILG